MAITLTSQEISSINMQYNGKYSLVTIHMLNDTPVIISQHYVIMACEKLYTYIYVQNATYECISTCRKVAVTLHKAPVYLHL